MRDVLRRRALVAGTALLVSALGVPLAGPATAGPAGLDPAWGENGIVALERPGRDVATSGTTTYVATAAADGAASVVALDAAGRLQASFGGSGRVVLPGGSSTVRMLAEEVATAADGRVLVTALAYDLSAGAVTGFDVVRLLPSGALDTAFGSSGRWSVRRSGARVDHLGVDADGRAYVVDAGTVRRLTPAGSLDSGWGSAGGWRPPDGLGVLDLAVDPAGGAVVLVGGTYGSAVWRLLPDGTRDGSFGGGTGAAPGPSFQSVWRLPSGRVLASTQGYAEDPPDLHAFTSQGEVDVAFGDAGAAALGSGCLTVSVTDVVEDAARGLTLVVRESCTFAGPTTVHHLSGTGEHLSAGAPDLDPARPVGVTALAGLPDGSVVAAGFEEESRQGRVARVLPDVAVRGSLFTPVVPYRVLDTRSGHGAPRARLGHGQALQLKVAGAGAVPASATAVVLNVTAVAPSSPGHVIVSPVGSTRPRTSNLNLQPGVTTPNAVTVKTGTDGRVELYNAVGTVDLVVDVAGWYAAGTGQRFTPLDVPTRVLDTRTGLGGPRARVIGGEAAARVLELPTSVVPAGATAVVLNLTAVYPTHETHVTAYPTGAAKPTASNLNMRPGDIVPNLVTVQLGSSGGRPAVSLYLDRGAVDLVADVAGWYGPGGETSFVPLVPVRLLDTRQEPDGPARPGETVPFDAELGGVPYFARAVVVNLTAVDPTGHSFVTATPYAVGMRGPASNLNTVPGVTVPNLAVVAPDDDGLVGLYNNAGHTHLLADVGGYFTD